ncbi:692_t:CDS:1, partial [Gigaspora rosea]
LQWFNKTSNNPKQEPFIVASKLEIEQPLMINWDGPILYLNVLTQDSIYGVQDINNKIIENINYIVKHKIKQ